jgi:glycerophosphoryl diester phosphodiesterase
MNKIFRTAIIILSFIVSVVVLAYGFAWLFPHKPAHDAWFDVRPDQHTPLVLAHQGGEGIRPTNTAVAFRDTLAMGVDVLDADIHMTKDGVLVLGHDETVDRTTNGTGAIRDMTYDQLKLLDAAYDFSTDGGKTFPYRGQGLKILTVDEFFDQFPNVRYGLEIKQTTPEAAEKLCQTIQSRKLEKAVLLSSFIQENMDKFRQSCPSVATSATEKEAKMFYIFHRLGLAGLYRAKFGSLQVPEYSGPTRVLTPRFVHDAQKKGIEVVPWTINEEPDLHRMIDLKVDGINTNYPDRLLKIIN